MAYSGTGAPPGTITYVLPGDSAATIQSKLNSVQAGNSLVFTGGTYDFGGATIAGKSGVTVWADGQVVIANAPGAGTHGAFDFSGRTDWTIGGKAAGQGFVFNGSLIDATNASNWAVGNAVFNNQQSNGYDGSAIRMNGASYATVINNDFNGAGGNVVGMYNLNHIRIDGNHFVNCWEPISIQEPTNADTSLGHNIVIEHNVFLGTQRAAIEIGPAHPGTEYFSGLIINNNYFDNFNNAGGEEWSTLLAISAVGQSSVNTTITNNYISRGPAGAGEVGVAIEMTGTGHVSGNTIVNFAFAGLAYQSGWYVHDNVVYNDGSSPYFGFTNNGSGSGTIEAPLQSAGLPASPAMPSRVGWGSEADAAGNGGTVVELAPSGAIDTVAPIPDFTAATFSDGQVTLTGTSEAGSAVWVYEGLSLIGSATAGGDGNWTITGAGDASAVHFYGAVAKDLAGNIGESTADYSPTTPDHSPTRSPDVAVLAGPAGGTVVELAPSGATDTVAPIPDFTAATFSDGQVTLTGTSEAGSAVWVYEGLSLIGSATAGGDGNWTIIGAGDASAVHFYGAVAKDLAGNIGESTADYSPTTPDHSPTRSSDVAVLGGPAGNYTVTVTAGSPAITVQDKAGANAGQTFTNIETLQFTDQSLDMSWFTRTAALTSAQIVSLVELYIASFNRAPDALGLDYWGSQLSEGMSLPAIAASFFVQPEAAAAYPAGQSTETFVTQVYHNVLGRAPDTAGLDYWAGQLQSGSVAKSIFLLAIINGAQSEDAQYLANKTAVDMRFALEQGLSDSTWARTVMSDVDGTPTSVAAAHAQSDGYAATAATDTGTELVVKILGIAA